VREQAGPCGRIPRVMVAVELTEEALFRFGSATAGHMAELCRQRGREAERERRDGETSHSAADSASLPVRAVPGRGAAPMLACGGPSVAGFCSAGTGHPFLCCAGGSPGEGETLL